MVFFWVKPVQKLSRRQFLGLTAAGLGVIGSGYLWRENCSMKPAPVQEGKILCDFHAHPSKRNSLDDITDMLGSPSLVGLAAKFIDNSAKDILLYEDAVDIERVKRHHTFAEITPGQLARYKEGYFARTQEVKADVFHLLAMGWKGDKYFQPYKGYATIEGAVQDIHSQQGIVVFNHPYFVARGDSLLVQFANEEEQERIRQGYQMVDEVEVHNAFCINLVPGLWANKANKLAEESLKLHSKHKGMADSDCHRRLRQVKIAGNYMDKSVVEQGMDGIVRAIKAGQFVRYGTHDKGPYVGPISWMAGVVGDLWSAWRK